MPTKWPMGKEPLIGHCINCKRKVRLHWSGINREHYCEYCGLVNNGRRTIVVSDRAYIREIVDDVYRALSKVHGEPLDMVPFMKVVDKKCIERLNGRVPMLKYSEFSKWGYYADRNVIKRVTVC